MTPRHQPRPASRWRRLNIVAAIAVVVASGMVVISAVFLVPHTSTMDSAPDPTDLAGNAVQFDGPGPNPSASATPSGTGRFQSPSVDLDVPLGSLDVVDNELEPPGFTSAYWVRNLGVAPSDGADGTVFVVMHSLRNGGQAPGNALIDVDNGRARISTGASIVVDDVLYKVVNTETVDKTQISHDQSVWADTPGRLVVITCLQRPDGSPSTDNMVIEAMRG
ncbi:hypothetical protein SAMN06295879_1314 [Agreia bicolorata]|uniref:Carboxylesterase n=1 Tax=Agreia bicolorata TaxID=110935 RepID=A0A1T4XLH1_9MICO|nr:class F sortase [Agreia bicolorata]KJC65044.1 carboxylesterase [Agreia bicolorata]SKA90429.1 hypothetical protein SAMN06295879_1314 [Agreia bicolorata]